MVVFDEASLAGYSGPVWQICPQLWVGYSSEELCDVTDFDVVFCTTSAEFGEWVSTHSAESILNEHYDDIAEYVRDNWEPGDASLADMTLDVGFYYDEYEEGQRLTDGGYETVDSVGFNVSWA